MKLLNWFIRLMAASSTATALNLNAACGDASSQCSHLDSEDVYECRKQISRRKLDIVTCQPVPQTITSTQIIRPTITVDETIYPLSMTKKVLSTVTLLGHPVVEPTTTLSATSTFLVGTVTIIDTTSSTQFEVATRTETQLETDTVVSTTTITSTTNIPWVTQACTTAARRRVFKLGRRDGPFPNKCSCFLTATHGAPSLKTATTAITEDPVTQTVLHEGAYTPTITRTVVVTAYLNVSTVSAPEITQTITESRTETSRGLTTVVETETHTVTATETRTATQTSLTSATAFSTATADPCADIRRLSVPKGTGLISPNIALSFSNEGGRSEDQIISCCRNCFFSPGCVFFRVNDHLCEGFGTRENTTESCTSDKCPQGQPLVLPESVNDGYDYFKGKCGAFA